MYCIVTPRDSKIKVIQNINNSKSIMTQNVNNMLTPCENILTAPNVHNLLI